MAELDSRLPLAWQIAWRTMRGRKSRVLGATARAALLATALGVTAMVIAMALMTGYTDDLERRLIGLQAEVVATPISVAAFDDKGPPSLDTARALEGVARIQPVLYGEGALRTETVSEGIGVVIRGVDSEDRVAAGRLGVGEDGLPAVLLGDELARRLGAEEGTVMRLVVVGLGSSRPQFRYRSVRLAGTFATGFAEFDNSWTLVDRGLLASLTAEGESVRMLEIDLEDDADVAALTDELRDLLGDDYLVTSWQELNHALFSALALQELVLFLVLGLIVLVSTFNVASTLLILVRERMRDVGALAAMGLEPRRIAGIFVLCGLLLGAAGTALGVAVGTFVSWLITEYELIRFDPEVAAIYFIDSVPFHVELLDVLAVVVFTLVVTFLACLLPARRAARIEPTAALRYE